MNRAEWRRAKRIVEGWRGTKAKRRKPVHPAVVQAFAERVEERLEEGE